MITVSKGERPLVISQTARIHFTGHASSRADGLRIAFFLSFFSLSFFLKFSLPTLLTSLPPSFPHYPSLRPDLSFPPSLHFLSCLALLPPFCSCPVPLLLDSLPPFHPSFFLPFFDSFTSLLLFCPHLNPSCSFSTRSLSVPVLPSVLAYFLSPTHPFLTAFLPCSVSLFPLLSFVCLVFPSLLPSFFLSYFPLLHPLPPSLPPPSPFFPCLSSTSHPHFLSSLLILFPSPTFPSLPSLALSLLLTSFLFFSISPSLALLYLPCLPFISFLWSFPSFLPFHCFFTLKNASIDASSSTSFNYNQPVWRQRGQNTADVQ